MRPDTSEQYSLLFCADDTQIALLSYGSRDSRTQTLPKSSISSISQMVPDYPRCSPTRSTLISSTEVVQQSKARKKDDFLVAFSPVRFHPAYHRTTCLTRSDHRRSHIIGIQGRNTRYWRQDQACRRSLASAQHLRTRHTRCYREAYPRYQLSSSFGATKRLTSCRDRQVTHSSFRWCTPRWFPPRRLSLLKLSRLISATRATIPGSTAVHLFAPRHYRPTSAPDRRYRIHKVDRSEHACTQPSCPRRSSLVASEEPCDRRRRPRC